VTAGNITRRGKHSWRLKFEVGADATGVRQTRFVTVKGTKKAAQQELTRLLAAHDAGALVDPSKVTVAEYLRTWIVTATALSISPKTAERYGQLIEQQIIPHMGAHLLQKLKPLHIANWHATLLTGGGKKGGPLSPRTVGHAHRVLSKAFSDAMRREIVLRNPAVLVAPPKVTDNEMPILMADQVKSVLEALRSTSIFPQVVVLLSTGMRRGELMGLQWGDVDLVMGKLRVARSVEKTKAHGLRIKTPKTKHGRRLITLPPNAVVVLGAHRAAQLETRMALGLGKLPADAYIFGTLEGGVRDPDRITQDWKRFTAARDLPKVTLQGLRHSHASALIDAGTDLVKVSRRLGHGSPTITLAVYAHLFDRGDEEAAKAIESVMKIDEQG
jgi:integrase